MRRQRFEFVDIFTAFRSIWTCNLRENKHGIIQEREQDQLTETEITQQSSWTLFYCIMVVKALYGDILLLACKFHGISRRDLITW